MLNDSDLLKLHSNQRLLVIEMQKRGINVDIIYNEREIIKAEYGDHIEWILDRDSSIMPYSVSIICGDKYITKRILEKNKVSVPEGEKFLPNEWRLSIYYARKIGFPVVINPVFGSHGDNIYMDVENEEELKDSIDETVTYSYYATLADAMKDAGNSAVIKDLGLTEEQTKSVVASASGIEFMSLLSPIVKPFWTRAEKPPIKFTPHSFAALSIA